jgi:hypothetical protein
MVMEEGEEKSSANGEKGFVVARERGDVAANCRELVWDFFFLLGESHPAEWWELGGGSERELRLVSSSCGLWARISTGGSLIPKVRN